MRICHGWRDITDQCSEEGEIIENSWKMQLALDKFKKI